MGGPKKSRPGARSAPRTPAAAQPGPERQLTHDDIMEASVRIDPELRRRSQLLWEDRSRSTRGPKATFTPEDVVEMAMGIADEDGLAAVTMQAVAVRLGLTTMALYRYFPNKDALIDAIVDAGLGRPPALAEPGGDWRAEVMRVAKAKRATLIARPWLAELPFVAAPHGPNWLSWHEAIIEPLSRTGLSSPDMGEMLSIIDGYIRGSSDTAVSLARSRARGIPDEQWAAAVGADLGRAIGDPRFPAFAALLMSPSDGKPRTMDQSFDFGLQRVLDGIELYIKRRS